MIIIKCIKNVEQELKVIQSELERELSKQNQNEERISALTKSKNELQNYIEKYKKILANLDDVEARIYYKIVYEGINPTKAIDIIAEENYLNDKKPTSSGHIFRKIYPKIKKEIEKSVKYQ